MPSLIEEACVGEWGGGVDLFAMADGLLRRGSGIPWASVSTELITVPWKAAVPVSLADPARLSVLRSFFEGCLTVFRKALVDDEFAQVRQLLLSNCPPHLGLGYHHALPPAAFSQPLFFRTDEAADGTIFEIQCPGSGWGDLILLPHLYRTGGHEVDCPDAAGLFRDQLNAHVPQATTGVMHLLDNSSNPMSMHHFMRATAEFVHYWGYSPDVHCGGCGFVRSHSVQGLVAENLFSRRLSKCADGKVMFDLPPIALFDQKAFLALPFLPATEKYFSEEVKSAVAFTSVIENDRFTDEFGERIALDQFCTRRASERGYFFKYAGFDTSLNWGSRGVRLGSSRDFHKELGRIRRDCQTGRPWIVQRDLSSDAEASICKRQAPELTVIERRFVKISRFYGPSAYFGAKIMASSAATVHGQAETAISIGVD